MKAKFRGVTFSVSKRKMAPKFKKDLGYITDLRGKKPRIVFSKLLWDRTKIKNRKHANRLLEILIHEPLHACFWDMDEAAITEAAKDIARFLKQMGVRVECEVPSKVKKREKKTSRQVS